MKVKSLSHVQLFATPWSVAYQAPPSMGFSRQEYWSGLDEDILRTNSFLVHLTCVDLFYDSVGIKTRKRILNSWLGFQLPSWQLFSIYFNLQTVTLQRRLKRQFLFLVKEAGEISLSMQKSSVYTSVLISQFVPSPSLAVSTCSFSTSASLFLPWN